MKQSLSIIVFSLAVSLAFVSFACADTIVITDDDINRMSMQGDSDENTPEPAIRQNTTSEPAIREKLTLPTRGKEARVNISDEVKRTWKSVIFEIKDKDKGSVSTYEVNIGAELNIPDSGIKVAVKAFLPMFIMQGLDISSPINEPANPAPKVEITENDRLLYSGWFFQKYPTTHGFTHPRFSIILTGEARY